MVQGLVTYPGIEQFEDFQITDISGISPAVGIMTMYPQYGVPAAFGDLVLTYDDNKIIFRNCTIDSASFQRNSGGQVVSVRFLDERWAWQYGEITGRYNIRLPNNFIDPAHERTPRQLATLCFNALGVKNFNVSALPNDARPDIDWDHANPAQELAKLCDDLGCRIVPQRSTGAWIICVTGEGSFLPDELPFQDQGDGIDPKEIPDFIKIVTAPFRYQVALPLESMGKETDLSYKPIARLSYAPGTDFRNGYGFGIEWREMSNISPVRFTLPDGTKVSPRELAEQTVFRLWRIAESDDVFGVPIPFLGNPKRKQIIVTDQLVQAWVDDRGVEHARPAFIFGSFYGEKAQGQTGNYPVGTRIDYQGNIYRESEEERASFSLSLDPIDTDRCFINTSKPFVWFDWFNNTFSSAPIFLMCSIQIRDPVRWQPYRYEFLRQVGTGTDTSFCLEVIKEDIQPWTIGNYDAFGDWLGTTTNNKVEVDAQCKYYADAIAKTFETIATSTRTYIGLFGIDMDGAIQQITYRITKSGADTIASRGTEHDFDIPKYWERRQRDGRRNAAASLALQKQILDRQITLRGTWNT